MGHWNAFKEVVVLPRPENYNDVLMLYWQAVPEQADTQLDDDTPSVNAEALFQSTDWFNKHTHDS